MSARKATKGIPAIEKAPIFEEEKGEGVLEKERPKSEYKPPFTEEELKGELKTVEEEKEFLEELKRKYGDEVKKAAEEALEKIGTEEKEYKTYASQAVKGPTLDIEIPKGGTITGEIAKKVEELTGKKLTSQQINELFYEVILPDNSSLKPPHADKKEALEAIHKKATWEPKTAWDLVYPEDKFSFGLGEKTEKWFKEHGLSSVLDQLKPPAPLLPSEEKPLAKEEKAYPEEKYGEPPKIIEEPLPRPEIRPPSQAEYQKKIEERERIMEEKEKEAVSKPALGKPFPESLPRKPYTDNAPVYPEPHVEKITQPAPGEPFPETFPRQPYVSPDTPSAYPEPHVSPPAVGISPGEPLPETFPRQPYGDGTLAYPEPHVSATEEKVYIPLVTKEEPAVPPEAPPSEVEKKEETTQAETKESYLPLVHKEKEPQPLYVYSQEAILDFAEKTKIGNWEELRNLSYYQNTPDLETKNLIRKAVTQTQKHLLYLPEEARLDPEKYDWQTLEGEYGSFKNVDYKEFVKICGDKLDQELTWKYLRDNDWIKDKEIEIYNKGRIGEIGARLYDKMGRLGAMNLAKTPEEYAKYIAMAPSSKLSTLYALGVAEKPEQFAQIIQAQHEPAKLLGKLDWLNPTPVPLQAFGDFLRRPSAERAANLGIQTGIRAATIYAAGKIIEKAAGPVGRFLGGTFKKGKELLGQGFEKGKGLLSDVLEKAGGLFGRKAGEEVLEEAIEETGERVGREVVEEVVGKGAGEIVEEVAEAGAGQAGKVAGQIFKKFEASLSDDAAKVVIKMPPFGKSFEMPLSLLEATPEAQRAFGDFYDDVARAILRERVAPRGINVDGLASDQLAELLSLEWRNLPNEVRKGLYQFHYLKAIGREGVDDVFAKGGVVKDFSKVAGEAVEARKKVAEAAVKAQRAAQEMAPPAGKAGTKVTKMFETVRSDTLPVIQHHGQDFGVRVFHPNTGEPVAMLALDGVSAQAMDPAMTRFIPELVDQSFRDYQAWGNHFKKTMEGLLSQGLSVEDSFNRALTETYQFAGQSRFTATVTGVAVDGDRLLTASGGDGTLGMLRGGKYYPLSIDSLSNLVDPENLWGGQSGGKLMRNVYRLLPDDIIIAASDGPRKNLFLKGYGYQSLESLFSQVLKGKKHTAKEIEDIILNYAKPESTIKKSDDIVVGAIQKIR